MISLFTVNAAADNKKHDVWFYKTGIWDVAFLDTSFCLFHSFEDEEHATGSQLVLYHTAVIEDIHTFRYQVLAAPFSNRVSFGICLRSTLGRWDVFMQGKDSLTEIVSCRQSRSDSILFTNKVIIKNPIPLDSTVWYSISFSFGDTCVEAGLNGNTVGRVSRPAGFDKKLRYGVVTYGGIVYFRDLQIRDRYNVVSPVINDSNLLNTNPDKMRSAGSEGVFIPD